MRRLGKVAVVLAALACALPAAAFAQSGAADDRISLESVAISGQGDINRLYALGFDVTHDVDPNSAVVALYSDAERARLHAAGFSSQTLIGDLAATNASERASEEAVAVPTALPSGRSTYRVYDDYLNDIDALAEDPDNAGLVRKLTIGQSFEGRDIVGLEIAADVNREDDGRPVYLQMGLHHAREWPSGEYPMEFAIDLVNGFNVDDPRIVTLLENTRVFVFPVINPDGFIVSRGAAPSAGGAPVIVGGFNEFRRKNCRPAPNNPQDAALPCALRPNSGVDLNRNYGYYWGGPGAGTSATAENYRGTGPFSEPESQAVHQFVSKLHPTVFITNHTFTDEGWWLRQPGFNATFLTNTCPPSLCAIAPDETAMKDLGDAMGGATGWPSDLGWELGDITGATEDWNYFAQGTYGYTPEARGLDFHSLYMTQVVEEYEGDSSHPGQGVREAFLIAGERAMNTADHGILMGDAPPGATLKLVKDFEAPTFNQPALNVDEHLETILRGPADGTYEWHVNPSDRPQVSGGPAPNPGDEVWTMTCQRAGQAGVFTKSIEVTRGQAVNVDWGGSECGAPPPDPNVPPVADFTVIPDPPVVNEEAVFTSTSTDSDGAIETTLWDLDDDGDFDDASGLVATHTFTSAGAHDVAVKVTDDDGDFDVETKTITVAAAPPPNVPPVAGFTFFPASPRVGDDVAFESTSTDADGTVTTTEWDIDGDGAYDDALGTSVTRAYTQAGTYPVSVRVTDDDGDSDTFARAVIVGPAPAPVHTCVADEATILGSANDDTLTGTGGSDVIVSMGGHDTVRGGGGADVICGRDGADTLRGGGGADTIIGGQGQDSLAGGAGPDLLRGNKGADVLMAARRATAASAATAATGCGPAPERGAPDAPRPAPPIRR